MSNGAAIADVEVFPPGATRAERDLVSGSRLHPEVEYLRALLTSAHRQELLLVDIRDAMTKPVGAVVTLAEAPRRGRG